MLCSGGFAFVHADSTADICATEAVKLRKITSMKPESILRVTTLMAAAASLALSVYIYFRGTGETHQLDGIYVGVWVPSILSLGAFLLAGRGKEK